MSKKPATPPPPPVDVAAQPGGSITQKNRTSPPVTVGVTGLLGLPAPREGKLLVTAAAFAAASPRFPAKDGRAFAVWANALGHSGSKPASAWDVLLTQFLSRAVEG